MASEFPGREDRRDSSWCCRASWVCYRLSGTELVVRVYSEARSQGDLVKLSAAAKAWIFD